MVIDVSTPFGFGAFLGVLSGRAMSANAASDAMSTMTQRHINLFILDLLEVSGFSKKYNSKSLFVNERRRQNCVRARVMQKPFCRTVRLR
jgi:hypothetical protein